MKVLFYSLVLACFLLSCKSSSDNSENKIATELPSYTAHKATSSISIDGKNDESDWNNAETVKFEHFYYHDSIKAADDEQITEFQMLWDDQYLYAFFKCSDKYITAKELNRDGTPYMDDCAELFLTPVPEQMSMHMGFEVNLFKVSNDFWFMTDYFNGQMGNLKAFNPDFDVEVTINGTINDNSDVDEGWTMEMAIPLKLFFMLDTYAPVQHGSKWTFLALRQDRNMVAGERRVTSTLFSSKVEDGFDVHAPSSFGYLKFEE